MMRYLQAAVIVGTLAVGASRVATAQASSSVMREERPYSTIIEHPCTGDVIELSGVVRVTYRTTVDAQGITHWTYTLVPDIEGAGASGATYKVVGGERQQENYLVRDEESFNGKLTVAFNVVGSGRTPGFVATTTAHLRLGPGGEFELFFYKDRVHCSGG